MNISSHSLFAPRVAFAACADESNHLLWVPVQVMPKQRKPGSFPQAKSCVWLLTLHLNIYNCRIRLTEAPVARFTQRLKDPIESGSGLFDSTVGSEQARAEAASMKIER